MLKRQYDLQSSFQLDMTDQISNLIQSRIRQDIVSMHAYAIQDSVGMVKLDAMENPHRLPADLQQQLGERLGKLALNRYPDGRVNDLRTALAAYADMPAGYDIMLGNGSDELISLLALACDVPGATILAPLPGFVMYAMSAQLQGLKFVGVDLTADFELDVPAMLAAIAQHKPAITYLAYPNNPTANLWDDAAMAQIIAAVGEIGGLVVLDEAYQPFSSKTYLDTIRANPEAHAHVLLMRTLSKFGLAGVRMGYMMGPKALIVEIDKVRPPYNISVLNYECALFSLEHKDVFSAQAGELIAQRAMLFESLSAIPNVKAFKSDANMMLLRVPDPQKTFEGMKAKGVLVKNVSKMHPLLAGCLRLTVGTVEENATMVAAIKASI
jgi:histidinol-phosphate aminotransferase